MLKPTTLSVDELQITYTPLPILKASHLDAAVLSIVMPVITSITGIVDIEKLDLSSDLSLDGLGRILGSTLAGLSEAVQETLIVGSLAGATIVAPGCPAIEIRDPATLNQAFQGQALETLYKAVLESWRFNKLTPFTLMARFGSQNLTDFVKRPKDEVKKSGLKLAK